MQSEQHTKQLERNICMTCGYPSGGYDRHGIAVAGGTTACYLFNDQERLIRVLRFDATGKILDVLVRPEETL